MGKKMFAALSDMADSGSSGVTTSSTIVGLKRVKKGGEVTIGVSEEVIDKLMNSYVNKDGKYIAICLTVDTEEYEKIKHGGD